MVNLIQYLVIILICKSILAFSNILDLNKDTSNDRLDLNYPTIHIVSPKNQFYYGNEINFKLVLKNIPKSLDSFTKAIIIIIKTFFRLLKSKSNYR